MARAAIGVIADDLTGAGDAALALERAGFRAEILSWPPPARPPRARAWVLSTESRSLPAAQARARARRAAAWLRRWKAPFVFKKIDSTLRGPIQAELDGLRDVLGEGPWPFVPAFPALGRTTVGGRHFVDGAPLHKTAFGRDPRHPLRTNDIAKIVDVRGLWIPDVRDERDLRRVASQVRRSGTRVAVGSAGFAAALFLKDQDRHPGEGRGPGVFKNDGKKTVLLVSGSAHRVSQRQADRARGLADVVFIEAPRRRSDPDRVLKDLVRRAAAAARRQGIRRFAVTGGETAAALARALGARRWRIVEELDRGVPLAVSTEGRRSWWVMKPGGFGREDLWTRAIQRLSKT